VTRKRQEISETIGDLGAEIDKAIAELGIKLSDLPMSAGVPNPDLVAAAAKLLRLVIQRGIYRFADAVLALYETVGPQLRKILSALPQAWNQLRAENPALDAATDDVEAIIKAVDDADSLANRPQMRVVDEHRLPQVDDKIQALVGDKAYAKPLLNALSEHQRYAVNLIASRYEKGGAGFMLADSAGTGKTRIQLASALAIHLMTNEPVLILSPSKQIIQTAHVREAETMGIGRLITGTHIHGHAHMVKWNPMVQPIRIETFSKLTVEWGDLERITDVIIRERELRSHKTLTGRQWGGVIFDEAHRLKNAETTAATYASQMRGFKVFCTATPMDRVTGAAYFLNEILSPRDLTFAQKHERLVALCNELGFSLVLEDVPVTDEQTGSVHVVQRQFARLNPHMTYARVRDNLIRKRGDAVAAGAMLRREVPFWGHLYWRNFTGMTGSQREILHRIDAHYSRQHGTMSRKNRMLELGFATEYTKAPEIMRLIEAELRAGRKVVVFANYAGPLKMNSLTPRQGRRGVEKKDAVHVPGLLTTLSRMLDEMGIDHARLYNPPEYELSDRIALPGIPDARYVVPAKDTKPVHFVDEIKRFQKGGADVLIGLYETGGTGVDLDDQIGDKPRTLILASPHWSGDQFEQAIFRVSRRNSKTPARVYCVVADTESDLRRRDVVEQKLRVLRDIQAGADPDLAREFQDESLFGPTRHYDIRPDALERADQESIDRTVKDVAGLTDDEVADVVQRADQQDVGAAARRVGLRADTKSTRNAANINIKIVPIQTPADAGPIRIQTVMEAIQGFAGRFIEVVRKPKALGAYDSLFSMLSVSTPGNFVTAVHELGHFLDHLLGLTSNANYVPALDSELARLWHATSNPDATLEYKRDEGVAEYVRYRIFDPDGARRDLPQFTARFDAALSQHNPTALKSLDQISELARRYFGQNPLTLNAANNALVELYSRPFAHRRILDRIDSLTSDPLGGALSRMYRRFVTLFGDSLEPVWHALRSAYRWSGIQQFVSTLPSQDPFVRIAQARSGSMSVVLAVLRFGLLNPADRTPLGTGPLIEYLFRPLIDASATQSEFFRNRDWVVGLMNAQRIEERAAILDAEVQRLRKLRSQYRIARSTVRRITKALKEMKKSKGDEERAKKMTAERDKALRAIRAISTAVRQSLRVIYGRKAAHRFLAKSWHKAVTGNAIEDQIEPFVERRKRLMTGVGVAAQERREYGMPKGDIDLARDATAELARMAQGTPAERRVADALLEAAKRYRDVARWMLDWAVEHGRLSHVQAQRMKMSNKFYVSWERLLRGKFGLNTGEVERSLGSAASALRRTPITHQVFGSGWEIADPYVALHGALVRILSECEMNAAALSFATTIAEPPPLGRGNMHDEPASRYLARFGVKSPNIYAAQALLRANRLSAIAYYRDGALRVLKVSPEIASAFETIVPAAVEYPILALPGRLYHWSITHSPAFAVRSVWREGLAAAILSDVPTSVGRTALSSGAALRRSAEQHPLPKKIPPLKSLDILHLDWGPLSSVPRPKPVKQYSDEEFAQYLAHGGMYLQAMHYDRDGYETYQRHIMAAMVRAKALPADVGGPWAFVRRMVPLVYRWLDGFERLVVEPEITNRMAVFKRAKRLATKTLGMDEYEAAWFASYTANQVCDYAKRGRVLRAVGAYLPFVSARIAGFQRTMAGLTSSDRYLTMLSHMAAWTIPISILEYLWAAAQGDDSEREFWQLPKWQKDFFWSFKAGDYYLVLPKPYELGILSSLFTRLIQHTRGDRYALDGFAQSVLQAIVPVGANDFEFVLWRGITEWMSNWSSFRHTHIISPYEAVLAPSERPGTRSATLLGKLGAYMAREWLGADIDPRGIDYYVRSTVPGVGWTLWTLPEASEDPLATAQSITGVLGRPPAIAARDVQFVLRQARLIGVAEAPEFDALRNLISRYISLPKSAYAARGQLARLIQEEGADLREQWENGLGRTMLLRQLATTISAPPPEAGTKLHDIESFYRRNDEYRRRVDNAAERIRRLKPGDMELGRAIMDSFAARNADPTSPAALERIAWFYSRVREPDGRITAQAETPAETQR